MFVIPAIDLKNGQCVRLLQGKEDAVTIYSNNPASTARRWEECGAKLLHVVDLDGAFTGIQKNLDAIIKIRQSVSIGIEVGGGIRDIKKIDGLISIGINRIILGTAVIEKPSLLKDACARYPGRILAGIDAKDGKTAVKGWVEITCTDAKDLAREMEKAGAAGIIYTDISRDGMLAGPNIQAMKEMVETVGIPIIASGGVSSIKDIIALKEIKNLWGVITGKAIYSGAVDLKEAIRIAQSPGF
jgi:phosphoribosylformimino-5-aminoimidazole carboxamide ribotide isomerase